MEEGVNTLSPKACTEMAEMAPPSSSTPKNLVIRQPFKFLTDKTPPELVEMIFSYLDAPSSVCLGLTCKEMFELHKSFHGVVTLQEETTSSDGQIDARLHHLLRTWMYTDARLVWGGKYGLKFITRARRGQEEQAITELKSKYQATKNACKCVDPHVLIHLLDKLWTHYTVGELEILRNTRARNHARDRMYSSWPEEDLESWLEDSKIIDVVRDFTVVKQRLQAVFQALLDNDIVLDLNLPDPGRGSREDDTWFNRHALLRGDD